MTGHQQLQKLLHEQGDEVAAMCAYRDAIIVATKRGRFFRIDANYDGEYEIREMT